jgi:hypothetical protein
MASIYRILISLMLLGFHVASATTEPESVQLLGNTYQFYAKTLATYKDAQMTCQLNGGSLAKDVDYSISATMQYFVVKHWYNMTYPETYSTVHSFWVNDALIQVDDCLTIEIGNEAFSFRNAKCDLAKPFACLSNPSVTSLPYQTRRHLKQAGNAPVTMTNVTSKSKSINRKIRDVDVSTQALFWAVLGIGFVELILVFTVILLIYFVRRYMSS